MDELIFGIILTVVAVLATFLIRKSKRENWDDEVKNTLSKYNDIFTALMVVSNKLSPELFKEVKDVWDKISELYDKEIVTKEDLQVLIDEAEDVYQRALLIIEEHRQ